MNKYINDIVSGIVLKWLLKKIIKYRTNSNIVSEKKLFQSLSKYM